MERSTIFKSYEQDEVTEPKTANINTLKSIVFKEIDQILAKNKLKTSETLMFYDAMLQIVRKKTDLVELVGSFL